MLPPVTHQRWISGSNHIQCPNIHLSHTSNTSQPDPLLAPIFGAKHRIRCKWWICTDSAPKIGADGNKRIFKGGTIRKLVKLHRICTYLFKFSAATLFSGPKFAKSKLNPDRNFKKTRLNPDCKSTTFCHSDWTFLKLISLKTMQDKPL